MGTAAFATGANIAPAVMTMATTLVTMDNLRIFNPFVG
jgi:hypothetical protein